MVKLVDHLVAGLHIDIDKRKEEAAKRQRLETQLCKLLADALRVLGVLRGFLQRLGISHQCR